MAKVVGSFTSWEKLRMAVPDGADVNVRWHDGWRSCKVLRYEAGYPVCETRNGGILVVDKLAALMSIDGK